MDTNRRNEDQNESNAGAGMNDNSGAVQKAVRKNASHPGDASHAAGMRKDSQGNENLDQDRERGSTDDSVRGDSFGR